jgi:hypothetical protein
LLPTAHARGAAAVVAFNLHDRRGRNGVGAHVDEDRVEQLAQHLVRDLAHLPTECVGKSESERRPMRHLSVTLTGRVPSKTTGGLPSLLVKGSFGWSCASRGKGSEWVRNGGPTGKWEPRGRALTTVHRFAPRGDKGRTAPGLLEIQLATATAQPKPSPTPVLSPQPLTARLPM